MAEEDIINVDPAKIMSAVTSGADFLFIAVVVIVFVGALIAFVFWMRWNKRHKHLIALRTRTNGGTDIVLIDRFAYIKNKGDSEKIHIWSLNENKPLPPDNARDVSASGTDYIEGYITDTGEVLYIRHSNKPQDIEFETLDTDDKEFYKNEFIQAESLYRQNNIWSILDKYGAAILIVLVFIITVVFWEQIMAPAVQTSQFNAEITKANAQITDKLSTMISDRQVLIDDAQQPIQQEKPTVIPN